MFCAAQDDIAIPDRHLGLIPTDELSNLQPLLEKLADLGETCFDWAQLMPLLSCDGVTASSEPGFFQVASSERPKVRVAVAQDAAFNFYYADNLDLLKRLGAELLPWSPLKDSALPEGTQGLILGGGFPEVFAEELAGNQSCRQAVKTAIEAGLPTYAECGGLMYLCEKIIDFRIRLIRWWVFSRQRPEWESGSR